MPLRPIGALALVSVLLATPGCSSLYHYPVNPPLRQVAPSEPRGPSASQRADDLLLIVAFSGGGTRAAALAYGVLETLRATRIPGPQGPHALSDEIDLISAVSGGAFPAGYFGLRGDAFFSDFEARFLRRNVTRGLLLRLLFPLNWLRLFSPRFGTSDLAAEYYDGLLFDGATFGDLWQGRGPDVHIQATDVVLGTGFSFSRFQFEEICSDLARFPMARAVAASAAFPVLFSPVTLRNRAGTCGWQAPAWMREALRARDQTSQRFHIASHATAYARERSLRFIHLLDGGLSDNLGLREPMEMLLGSGSFPDTIAGNPTKPLRRVALVLVNAETRPDLGFGVLDVAPSLASIVDAVSSTLINRYNYETVELWRRSTRSFVRAARARGRSPVRWYTIQVNFEAHPDPEERRYLSALPTSLHLGDEAIDRLRGAAVTILEQNADFRALVRDLRAGEAQPTRGADPGAVSGRARPQPARSPEPVRSGRIAGHTAAAARRSH
ncbi:MAG: patatin-like phospholipase family protein [Myxococcota bacterium]